MIDNATEECSYTSFTIKSNPTVHCIKYGTFDSSINFLASSDFRPISEFLSQHSTVLNFHNNILLNYQRG